MNISSKTKEIYIPKAYQNRTLPESEQIVVHIKHPTQSEFDRLTNRNGFDGVAGVTTFVTRIDHLQVDGKAIDTGEKLVTIPKRADVVDLVSEITLVLLNGVGLPEVEVKNSDAPPS